jgi:hypothetical protein
MSKLSKRAQEFLDKSERDTFPITREEIISIFKENNAPIFEPLIDFQLNYGGYTFYAGLVSIRFTLFQGDGGYPERSNTAVIEFDEPLTQFSNYHFYCAITDYQSRFTLDEYGRYYEEFEPLAESFSKLIEQLSIWDKVSLLEGYSEFLMKNEANNYKQEQIIKNMEVSIIPEASDSFTQWFKNEFLYLTRRKDGIRIITNDEKQVKARLGIYQS